VSAIADSLSSLGKLVRIAGLETKPARPHLSDNFRKLSKYNVLHKAVPKPPEPIKESLAQKVFLNLSKMPVFSTPTFLKVLCPTKLRRWPSARHRLTTTLLARCPLHPR
jgi:hypothetical protein